jgi:hypothetical protein
VRACVSVSEYTWWDSCAAAKSLRQQRHAISCVRMRALVIITLVLCFNIARNSNHNACCCSCCCCLRDQDAVGSGARGHVHQPGVRARVSDVMMPRPPAFDTAAAREAYLQHTNKCVCVVCVQAGE